ncbi:hypothetical protein, partial [Microcoleus sp. herbarium2]|uniref:hypothetical protein n=1 Tax=Microcoleus sp. herbarium2 TaxID=3055433 RepID=UPI002FCEE156
LCRLLTLLLLLWRLLWQHRHQLPQLSHRTWVASARHIAANRDPLQHYAALEQAIASGWILSTAEVRALIGVKPSGDRFKRGAFAFIRADKVGNQAGWKVEKI